MAVFGRDFYGLTKYGTEGVTEFGVAPFTAVPLNYGSIHISWHRPEGDWTTLRLLQSKQGYAVNENDGEILLDLDSSTGVETFVVGDLAGGTFYYYTLFILVDGEWHRAGGTSSLVVKKPLRRRRNNVVVLKRDNAPVGTLGIEDDFGNTTVTDVEEFSHAELLWELIPKYMRSTRRRQATNASEPMGLAEVWDPTSNFDNPDLRRFLSILGWGLDYLTTYHETLRISNDPYTMHLENLDRLLRERGSTFEYGVPPRLMRSRAANAALLARKRGTFSGLVDDVALATGYDVDLNVGPNLMLNQDQSNFESPLFAEWDSGVNYPVGQRVQYVGRIYRNLVGALGDAQKPPNHPTTTNTWWILETELATLETLRDATTGGISSWRAYIVGGGAATTNESIAFTSPVDAADHTSNSLAVTNNTGGAAAVRAIGAANLTGDNTGTPTASRAVKQGIPIPRAFIYDSEQEYLQDTLVDYQGVCYRALADTTGSNPADDDMLWEKIGYDRRPAMAVSFYAQGDQSGAPGTGGVVVVPEIYFYDDKGTLLDTSSEEDFSNGVFWDTFNVLDDFSGRVPDLRWTAETWTANTGTFDIWTDTPDRVAYATSAALAVTTFPVPAALTTYKVAVDFVTDAAPGRTQALVLRYIDATNWFRVTRTKVQKSNSGVITDLDTHDTAIVDGDRVEVQVNDTTGVWVVRVNGTTVSNGTGFNAGASTPYKAGMMVT